MGEAPATIAPEILERLRRSMAIRMTASGRFEIDGQPVTHARIEQALRKGLDVTEAGEPTVRIGPQWCYLTIDDLPLRATSVSARDDQLYLRLDDGRTVPLDVSTLWEEPTHGLRAQVPSATSGRPLPVRLSNRARVDLSAWIEPDDDGRPVLAFAGVRQPIPDTPPRDRS